MTIATTSATLPRNLKERVASYPEVVYAETAFRGRMEHEDVRFSFKTPLQCGPLPNNTFCHEYLAIDFMAGDLKEYKKIFLECNSENQARYEVKIARKMPAKEPAAYCFYSYGLVLTIWLQLLRALAAIFSFVGILSIIFLSIVLVFRGINSISEFILGLIPSLLLYVVLPVTIYFFTRYLDDEDVLVRFNKAPGIRLVLRRDTGMVQFKKKGRFVDVPFSEVMGMTRHHTDDSGIRRITLHLNHKHSKLNRNLDSGLQALGSALHENERWWYYLRWEFMQHYMDVTRPLPDVPELEPYRHLDPTTREWDKKHNRPKDYWLNMDEETYEKMVKAAKEKAKTYPYDESDLAEHIGWTPAEDGRAWYQLG